MQLEQERDARTAPAPQAGPHRGAEAGQASSAVRLGPSQILALAVWFGVLTGLGEIAAALFKVSARGDVGRALPQLLWMGPVADVLLMSVPGLLLALGATLWP